jgi:hypothetical protein
MPRDERLNTMATPKPSARPADSDEIPNGDFIDVVSNQPVDPARLQVFQVPQEFMEAILSTEPVQVHPDDVRDIAPRSLELGRHRPVPVTEATATKALPARPKAQPASATTSFENNNPTVSVRAQRRTSWLVHLALSGKLGQRVTGLLAAILGILVILWCWMRWGYGYGAETRNSTAASSATSVQLLPAPEPEPKPQLNPVLKAGPTQSASLALGVPSANASETPERASARQQSTVTESNKPSKAVPKASSSPEQSPSVDHPTAQKPSQKSLFPEE